MANRVTIDVEARFIDSVSAGMNSVSKSAQKADKAIEEVNKELDKTQKKTAKPKIDANDNAFTKKIKSAQQKADKLGRTKASATLGAIDKASSKIAQITSKAVAFGSKVFKGTVSFIDRASSVIGTVNGAARSFAGKTFKAAVKIVDYATTPLRKIKDSLFSIKTLVAAITTGLAAKQFVINPINLADSYSSAQIGFSTLLGEEGGQAMMDDIDVFAKATPFKTSNVISNVQKMMAYGWDASRVISDMETIGDAAAATGKGDQGLESIVYALSEIRSKGKLSTQELNQLASAGIKAKAYLAEGLGYGTDDKGMAKLAKDLEAGAIGANQAVELILQGMQEFDGMMDKTANETVEGLWSQIEDTFEINVFRRWGQGLQDGAKKGFGSIVDLLNSSEDALQGFGDLLYDIGKEISNWGADKLDKFVKKIYEITESGAFRNASLGGKIKLLWEGTVVDPLKEWWNSEEVQSWIDEKKEWLGKKAGEWGESLGRGLSNGLLTLLGVDVTDAIGEGVSLGASFAEGFAEGFDGSAVTDALVDAIKNVWSQLPTWAKWLIGGYVGGKAIQGTASLINGIGTIAGGIGKVVGGTKAFIGTTGNAMMQGTGLLNTFANTGYALTGGATTAGGYFGAGTAMTGAQAAAIGGASIAGGVMAGASTIKGGIDLYQSYKAYKAGDMTEAKANAASGGTAIGGVASGAAIGATIGSIIPGLGTAVGGLIGAGIGGVAGWFGGEKWAKKIREDAEAAKYASEDMKEAVKDSEISAEELQQIFQNACWDDMKDRFGDIELSMEEIEKLAKNVVYDLDSAAMKKFAEASAQAEKSLANFKSAASDMDRLNFDMGEHAWKFNMGIEEKLSDEEIADVKARVQNFIDSAETALSDQHYQFNAAVEVLLQPKEGEDNSTYNTLIENGNNLYAKLQEQLNSHSEELTAQYNIALEDGIITADEQKIISEIQGKISEIINKVSNAETEASFEVSKMKFTTGELSAETFQQFQSSLQSQLESYVAEQDEALTLAISNLNLQLEEKEITKDQYKQQLEELVGDYNTNIDSMTARVSEVQLEGIAEAFDGVGTVEELQSAINELVANGEDPLDITFSDINAKLDIGEDILSEEAKTNFTSVMQEAIKSAASGENALKTTAEVDPEFKINDEILAAQNQELTAYLTNQLEGGEEGNTITPSLNVDPTLQFEEGAGESMKNELSTQASSYLTGENSINTTANVYAAAQMYGSGGTELSEEANKGRGAVKGAIDTAFTDPFSASADANITLNWKITNPSKTLSFSGGGGNGSTVTATVGGKANGGFVSGGPQLSWLDEEGMGEVVIPFNPSRRARALQLFAETGRRLGVLNHADGGFVGGESAPIQAFDGDVPAGKGEQKIEINMGGVNIEIKADGNKSMVENIEDQEEAIAEKVAAIFKSVFSAQFANMPLKSST